jgi:hypothetical protein
MRTRSPTANRRAGAATAATAEDPDAAAAAETEDEEEEDPDAAAAAEAEDEEEEDPDAAAALIRSAPTYDEKTPCLSSGKVTKAHGRLLTFFPPIHSV